MLEPFHVPDVLWIMLGFGFVSLLLCRWKPVLGFVCLPLGLWFANGVIRELYEPSIYDSVQVEMHGWAEWAYWAAGVIAVLGPVAGVVWCKWSRRRG